MYTSKKRRYSIEMNFKELICKTKEETDLTLYSMGFRKNKEGLYVRKTNLFSTTKLEIYSENNITLMITVYENILRTFRFETVVI